MNELLAMCISHTPARSGMDIVHCISHIVVHPRVHVGGKQGARRVYAERRRRWYAGAALTYLRAAHVHVEAFA